MLEHFWERWLGEQAADEQVGVGRQRGRAVVHAATQSSEFADSGVQGHSSTGCKWQEGGMGSTQRVDSVSKTRKSLE